MKDHIHDLTGPTGICECGWELKVPRFSISFDVSDGQTVLVSDCFHSDSIYAMIEALREAADELEEKF
jgi:hypothetical protein